MSVVGGWEVCNGARRNPQCSTNSGDDTRKDPALTELDGLFGAPILLKYEHTSLPFGRFCSAGIIIRPIAHQYTTIIGWIYLKIILNNLIQVTRNGSKTYSCRNGSCDTDRIRSSGDSEFAYAAQQVNATFQDVFFKLSEIPRAGSHPVVTPAPYQSRIRHYIFFSLLFIIQEHLIICLHYKYKISIYETNHFVYDKYLCTKDWKGGI